MNDATLTLLLRLIHILAGVFWVGAIFLIAGFLLPTARATGREGGRFMQHLMLQRRLPLFLGVAGALTVLSGFTMYGRLLAATDGAWGGTPPGMAYGADGLAAVLGGVVGGPAEEQVEIERLQRRMALGSQLVAGFLAFSAGTMAVARYL